MKSRGAAVSREQPFLRRAVQVSNGPEPGSSLGVGYDDFTSDIVFQFPLPVIAAYAIESDISLLIVWFACLQECHANFARKYLISFSAREIMDFTKDAPFFPMRKRFPKLLIGGMELTNFAAEACLGYVCPANS